MTTGGDPDRIRADIERTQASLSSDVDALSDKVTPGRIVERRVGRARGTAARWKEKVMGSDSRSHVVTGTHSSSHGGGLRDGAQHAAHQAQGSAQHAQDAVAGAASSAGQTLHDAPQAARRQAQGNPLAAGLIAFGAGWLISSLLPASQREQQLTAEAKDRVVEHSQPVVDAAKQAAGEMQENLQGPAQHAAEQVRDTATEAGRTVADEGRSATGQVQDRAQQAPDHVRGAT